MNSSIEISKSPEQQIRLLQEELNTVRSEASQKVTVLEALREKYLTEIAQANQTKIDADKRVTELGQRVGEPLSDNHEKDVLLKKAYEELDTIQALLIKNAREAKEAQDALLKKLEELSQKVNSTTQTAAPLAKPATESQKTSDVPSVSVPAVRPTPVPPKPEASAKESGEAKLKERMASFSKQYEQDQLVTRNLAQRPEVHEKACHSDEMLKIFRTEEGKLNEQLWVALAKIFENDIGMNMKSRKMSNNIPTMISEATGYSFDSKNPSTLKSKKLFDLLMVGLVENKAVTAVTKDNIILGLVDYLDLEMTNKIIYIYVQFYLNNKKFPPRIYMAVDNLLKRYGELSLKDIEKAKTIERGPFLEAVAFQISRTTEDQQWLEIILDVMAKNKLINKENFGDCAGTILEICMYHSLIPTQRKLFNQLNAASNTGVFEHLSLPNPAPLKLY